jgi:hypothetical protein
MSAGQALRAARAAGIHLEVEGDDLLLEAPAPPPTAVLDALSRHKAEIVRILHPAKDGWSAEDWRLYFEERAASPSSTVDYRALRPRLRHSNAALSRGWIGIGLRLRLTVALGAVNPKTTPQSCRLGQSREPGCTANAGQSGGKCVHFRRRKL